MRGVYFRSGTGVSLTPKSELGRTSALPESDYVSMLFKHRN